jgi:hypothetical protein
MTRQRLSGVVVAGAVLYGVLLLAGRAGAQTEGPLVRAYIVGQAAGASGLTDTELRASAVPVSATNLDVQSGGADLATAAGQTTANGHLSTLATAVGASTLKRYISAGATEDESEVKATAGTLDSISARNDHASADAHLKCTNLTAANTTPGTSTIFYEMLIPHAGGFVDSNIVATFDTALTCYIVLGKADNAVDEVAANDVSYNLRYR